MKGWIKQQEPLSMEERSHLMGGTDFVALVEKQEEGWLDEMVERALAKCFPGDVRSFPIPARFDLTHYARASLLRPSNVVSTIIQAFTYAASIVLMC